MSKTIPRPDEAQVPEAPKKKRKVWLWVVVGIVVVLAIASSQGGGDSNTPAGTDSETNNNSGISSGLGSNDASGDVTVGRCDSNYGIITCALTVVNHSDGRSDYYIEATIEDSTGAKIGTANTLITGVEGGQTAHDELIGTVTGSGKNASIRLTEVQRTASS